MTYEEKRKLVEAKGITLDGKPARIYGARLDYAIIAEPIPDTPTYQWGWEQAKRIVDRDGKFYS